MKPLKTGKSRFSWIYGVLTAVALFFVLFQMKALAEGTSNLAKKEIKLKVPISITSKKMTVNHSDQLMVFEGQVKVVKEDLTLTSDRVNIKFSKSKSGTKNKPMESSLSNGEISRILAEGNVHIYKGKREATAEKAEYLQEEELIILTGSPEGWDNHYKISGNKMTIYLKEDRSVIEGSHVLFKP